MDDTRRLYPRLQLVGLPMLRRGPVPKSTGEGRLRQAMAEVSRKEDTRPSRHMHTGGERRLSATTRGYVSPVGS